MDPWRPVGWRAEPERRPDRSELALTVFLTGAECPFTCAFCDLWQHTLDGPTPPGALPAQLAAALGLAPPGVRRVKLYNASNFFDPRAVPPADVEQLARQLRDFDGVTVESHARTIGPRCLEFANRLDGRLEVALGLETVHPAALPRLNKRMELADFDRAASWLLEHGLDLRVFVLVGAPFVPAAESVAWAVRSAAPALARGAGVVALIPARGGNGEMERLAAQGSFSPPTLQDLEAAVEGCLDLGGVVTADLWDVERLAGCPACRAARVHRIVTMNQTGKAADPVRCGACPP